MGRSLLFRGFVRALYAARRANLEEAGQPAPVARRARVTRRDFLKSATAAGTAAAIGLTYTGDTARAEGVNEVRVAVVGGGIAGLNAAYQLKKAGVTANVYEASSRVGGRIFSRTGVAGDGLVTELGAEFINSDHAEMIGLAEEFGLPLFNLPEAAATLPCPSTRYYYDGAEKAESEIADDLRQLAAQIASDSALLDEDYDRYAARFDRISAAEYLDQHIELIAAPYLRTLIESSIRTEYGVEADESSALQLILNLPTVDGQSVEVLGYSDEMYAVEGGNSRIIEGLAAALEGQIHTGKRLTMVEAAEDEGYRLTFQDGETIEADYVVIAIPFTVLRAVKIEIDMPRKMRRFIEEASLGANEKVIAGFSNRVWRGEAGFASGAWTDLGYSFVWDSTQRQPDHADGALTFYLGGEEVAREANGAVGADAVGQVFVERLDPFLPGLSDAVNGKYVRTRWTTGPFSRGAYSTYKPGQLTRFGELLWIESDDPEEAQECRAGNLFLAGEHLSDEYYGFMNGAAQTGRLAAGVVMRSASGSVLAP